MTKKTRTRGDDKKKPPASIDRDLQAKIGAQLRAMHDDIIQEGVPDRFRDLLARLDRDKKD
jgi:hypothetical protein